MNLGPLNKVGDKVKSSFNKLKKTTGALSRKASFLPKNSQARTSASSSKALALLREINEEAALSKPKVTLNTRSSHSFTETKTVPKPPSESLAPLRKTLSPHLRPLTRPIKGPGEAPKALSARSSRSLTQVETKTEKKPSSNLPPPLRPSKKSTNPPTWANPQSSTAIQATQKVDTPQAPNPSQEKLVSIMKGIIEDLVNPDSKNVIFKHEGKNVYVTHNGEKTDLSQLVKNADISNLKIDKEFSDKFSDFLDKKYADEELSKADYQKSGSELSYLQYFAKEATEYSDGRFKRGLMSETGFPRGLATYELKAAPRDLLLHIFTNQTQ